jgi:hypothetical protein
MAQKNWPNRMLANRKKVGSKYENVQNRKLTDIVDVKGIQLSLCAVCNADISLQVQYRNALSGRSVTP